MNRRLNKDQQPIPESNPRRRVPIEQERDNRTMKQKFDESQKNLFSVLFGTNSDEDPNTALSGNLDDSDLEKKLTLAKERVQPLNQMYHDSNAVAPDKSKQYLNNDGSVCFELKYDREYYVYQDDPIVPQILEQRNRPPRDFSALSPAQIKNQLPPKLVIPRSKPTNTNRNSSRPLVKKLLTTTDSSVTNNNGEKSVNSPQTARNALNARRTINTQKNQQRNVKEKKKEVEEIIQNEDEANEFLYLYDDKDYDVGIIEVAKEKLKNSVSNIGGFSLFCNSDFVTDWMPCKITKISDDNEMITIKFDEEEINQINSLNQTKNNNKNPNSITLRNNFVKKLNNNNEDENISKEKEVHRISVRFDFENNERFNKRRISAEKTRKELDMECRIQAKIIKISKSINDPSNPQLITEAYKKLNEKERNQIKGNNLFVELSENFILAEAKFQYILDWNDPVKRNLLKKENLQQASVYLPSISLPGQLQHNLITRIQLPDYSVTSEIVEFLMEYEERDVLKEMFDTVDIKIELKKFFVEIKFNMQTLISFAQGQMYRKLYNLTYDMIEGKPQKKQELIMTMVDFRLFTVLSNQITKILYQLPKFMEQKGLKFVVSVNEVLKTEKPNLDEFIKVGTNEIEAIYKTFDTSPVMKIQAEEIDKPNVIKTEFLDKAHTFAVEQWTKFFTNDFNELHILFAEMLEISSAIPENPFDTLIEILPRDFFTVLMKNEKPIVEPNEIDFEKIHNSLEKATNAINKINFDFQHVITLKFITADLSPFFKMINGKFLEYQQYIYRYLTAYSDDQLSNLLELINSLHSKMSLPSSNVEQWHNKRCLIEHIKQNFESMNKTLNFVIKLIEFLSDFLYESHQNYSNVYEAKIKLYQFFQSISTFEQQLSDEKGDVTNEHKGNTDQLAQNIDDFLNNLYEFHFLKVEENDVIETAEKLDQRRHEFESLKNLTRIYNQRDEFLGCDIYQYNILNEIEFNFHIFETLWNISRLHNTKVEKWLSTNFTEVNVAEITETLKEWSIQLKEIKNLVDVMFDKNQTNPFIQHIQDFSCDSCEDGIYPLCSSVDRILKRNEELIGHIPILRELSNTALRARHWNKISEVIGLPIDTNEGATWYWLIESNIENHLLLISSISRSARMELQIEKNLQEMCDELRTLKLKTTHKNGMDRLDDPSYAFEMIGSHRQKMQEIFVPPYVQPFLSKIADYEILANNLKQILKQTLEAQEKIDELQPAIESEDIKAQAPELASSFKEKISQFNNFTKSFKLNISFHQIVSNQRFVEMSRELNVGLDAVKDDMKKVLEKKRQFFPRFRFLSDSQLVSIISNSRTPSATKELFSLMYPAIKEAVIEDEQVCTGFKSFDNETFLFKEKVWVNHNCVEKWHLTFDQQIACTLKQDLRKLIDQPLADVDKIALQYPSQTVLLYLDILFTSMVTKAYNTIESVLIEKLEQSFNKQFQDILNMINAQINILHQSLQSFYKPQTSNLLLTLGRQKYIIKKILKDKLTNSKTALWISTPKFFFDDETNVTVSIGDVHFNYGFDYIGFAALPLFGNNEKIFNSLALLANSGYTPLVCGPRAIKKTNLVFSFSHIVGRQPFVFPCVSHSSFERIKQMAENVQKVNSFLVLKDIFQLRPDVLNKVCIMLINTQKERVCDCSIFATTSIENGSFVEERYRVAFRPIIINEIDIHYVLQSIFSAHGIDKNEKIAGKIETLIALIGKTFPPPLSSSLTPSVIIKIIRQKPFTKKSNSNSYTGLENEIHKRLNQYFTDVLGYDDLSQLLPLLDKVLGPLQKEETIALPSKLSLLEHFMKSLELYTCVIVLGDPLCGKTTLIEQAREAKNADLKYINPLAIDFKELYGDTSSGLLGYLLQNINKQSNDDWIVFDGSCEDSWMDILTLAFSPPKRFSFCDGSMLNLPNSVRFIIETSDISAAAPSTLSLCATVFVSKEEVSLDQRLDHFLKSIESDSRIVEQLSKKIIGSSIDAEELLGSIRTFSKTFIPKIYEFVEKQNMTPILSFLHFINNYFTLLSSTIFEYYYVESNDSLDEKHSADELIKDIPHLSMFSLFWTFVAPFSEDNRRKIDGLIHSLIGGSTKYNEIFSFKRRYLSEVFFNTTNHQWEEWNRGLSASLFLANHSTEESLDSQLTEMTPMHLLIPESTLYPTLFITRTLITQNKNIMFSGSSDVDKAVISDLCFRSPYAVNNLAPTTYLFQRNGTHHLLREMVQTILPDTRYSPSFSLRKPFLSLIDLDTSTNSSAGELIRFITEHDFMYNTKTYVKEMTSGLRFLITTEEKEINPRLAHHLFVINIPSPDMNARIDTLTKSIQVLWNIETNANVIASSLLSLLNESTKYFSFNIKHIFQLIHRVAAVSQNKPHEFLCEAIAHESVRVFYDPAHNNQILNKINSVTKHLSSVLNGKFIDSFEISDKTMLTNFNSFVFDEYSVDTDLDQIMNSSESISKQTTTSKRTAKLKFASSSSFNVQKNDNILNDYDPYLRMDVLRLGRIVSLPRMHAFIMTNLEFLPKQLIVGCQKLIGGEIHYYKTDNLMRSFHDAFLKAGQTQTHQYLLVEVEELNKDEKLLLMSLLHNYNVFNLFQRGEMLKILTKMYRKGESTDSFGDSTLESAPNYNELTIQFLVNCVTYFHWVLADHPPLSCPEFIEYSAALQPFFATDFALKSYVVREFKQNVIQSDWISNIEPERFEALLTKVRLDPLFETHTYTKSYSYSLAFLKEFIDSYNELCGQIEDRKTIFIEIEECSNKLSTFLKDTHTSLKNMESDLVVVTQQIEESMTQLTKLNEITQSQKEQLEKETAVLYQEEAAAAAMKKECESEITASKAALNLSAQELKGLSSRDIAVIKGMNHPPRGVLLIVRALLFILGIDKNVKANEDNAELEQKWSSGKKILNDPSFISSLIDKSSSPLSLSDMQKLKIICSDENFEPSIVERSSSAAKSICKFIRSLLPYTLANLAYKEKMKEMEGVQEKINQLRQKHNDAMTKLNEANRESISLQNKQVDNIQSKISTEERLKTQREKIIHYSELYEMIEPLFNEWNEQRREFESFASIASVQIIMKLFYHNWGSPLSNQQRTIFLQKMMNILSDLSIECSPLIDYAKQKTKINDNDIKSLRNVFIPQSNQNVYHKCRFKYPVSENWLENALFLSSDNQKWCIVEGLNQCPISYLKQICLTSNFVFISVDSPNFENEFIRAIKSNSFVLLFDFNFDSPNSLVIRTQQAMKEKTPLRVNLNNFNEVSPSTPSSTPANKNISNNNQSNVGIKKNNNKDFAKTNFNNTGEINISISHNDDSNNDEYETINVDPGFIVYFDAASLVGLRVVRLDLGLIKLGFEEEDVCERLRFALFETTDLALSEQMKRLESSLLAKEDELLKAQNKLKDFMMESNVTIFDDASIQTSFVTQIREIKVLKQEINSIDSEHNELMTNIGNSLELATELVNMFKGTIVIKHLWRIFDRCLSKSLDGFDFEKLKSAILTSVVSEFGFSNTIPIFAKILNQDLTSELNTALSFDKTIDLIEEKYPTVLFNNQCPTLLMSIAKNYHRPVILNASNSVWLSSLMITYVKAHLRCNISSANEVYYSVKDAINTGKVVITLCSSDKEMKQIMPAISFVLSLSQKQYVAPDFAFFIIITSKISSSFPIHKMCEFVEVEQPLHFGATSASSMQGLSRVVKSIDFSTLSMLSLFDASINTFSRIVHNGFHYNFCDSIVTLEFMQRNGSVDILEIGKYVIHYLYSTEFKNDVNAFDKIWNKIFDKNEKDKGNNSKKLSHIPKNSSMLTSQIVSKMPFNFDLNSLGFSPNEGDYFKIMSFRKWKVAEDQQKSTNGGSNSNEDEDKMIKFNKKLLRDIEDLKLSSFWINEKQISHVHVISILARRAEPNYIVTKKIEQVLSNSDTADISLLFDPVVFLNNMRIDFSIENSIDLAKTVLYLENIDENNKNKGGQKIKGLICIGAEYNNGRFEKKDGCNFLPTLIVRAGIDNEEDQEKNNINEEEEEEEEGNESTKNNMDNIWKNVDLFYMGQIIFSVKIKIDADENSSVFFQIPEI